jgi:ribonuclease R
MEAEREVIDIYRAYFMRDRIGDVFEGTISAVLGFGVFVTVDHPFIEGLVRVEALSDDYYELDEATARLVGRRSGRTFALGDTVKVEVQSVSVVRRKIDFALHEHQARERKRAAAFYEAVAPRGGRDRTRRGRPGGGEDEGRGQREGRRAAAAKDERRGRKGPDKAAPKFGRKTKKSPAKGAARRGRKRR